MQYPICNFIYFIISYILKFIRIVVFKICIHFLIHIERKLKIKIEIFFCLIWKRCLSFEKSFMPIHCTDFKFVESKFKFIKFYYYRVRIFAINFVTVPFLFFLITDFVYVSSIFLENVFIICKHFFNSNLLNTVELNFCFSNGSNPEFQ